MGSLACRAGENKSLLQNASYGLAALKALLDAILTDTGTTLEAKLDTIDSIVDAILVDTGTTLEAKLDTIDGIVDAIRTELTFQHQAAAEKTQANPVQNTWYTVLDTTPNVRLYSVVVRVDTTNETLEVMLTIDGLSISGSFAATAGTWYYAYINLDAPTYLEISNQYRLAHVYSFLEGRSVKVEVRKTTAAGTGTIYCRASYGKR